MKELLPINIMLSGRSYRIRVQPAEEAAIRKAVKDADRKINELRRRYAGKDDQDFLAMCLIMYAADAATGPEPGGDNDEALQALIARVDRALTKE